ncbi:MAG: hypothetical protein KY450_03380 [Actinobacteria bacterium]|nr:hypothetical protein [Actinomycetota bacterium]
MEGDEASRVDPRERPDGPGEGDLPSDWGTWLRNRLEQPSDTQQPHREGPDDEAVDHQAVTSAAASIEDEPPEAPEDEAPAVPSEPPIREAPAPVEDVALPESAEPPPVGADPRIGQELTALPAELPDEAGPQVIQGLLALRAAIDDTVDRLDHLTTTVLSQANHLEDRLDDLATTTAERHDATVASITEQQWTIRGAIAEVLDRTDEANVALDRLRTDPPAPPPVDEDPWRSSLQLVSEELATAAEAHTAELATLGQRLGRLEGVLERLVSRSDRSHAEAPPAPAPVAVDPPVVELDEVQTAAIADAVAAMLSGSDPPALPVDETVVGEPEAEPEVEVGPAPTTDRPPSRPRRRSAPLRARPPRSTEERRG